MESSEASWHSFDPSAAMEDSDAMAQLLGVQYFGNEQQKQPAGVYWPGQDADQYCGGLAPYYYTPQHHNSGASYDEHGYFGGGTVAMAGDFFVPGEDMADPSFILDLNLEFEDQDGGGKPPPACKRKLELEQKDEISTTGIVPNKKRGRPSTATPVSAMNELLPDHDLKWHSAMQSNQMPDNASIFLSDAGADEGQDRQEIAEGRGQRPRQQPRREQRHPAELEQPHVRRRLAGDDRVQQRELGVQEVVGACEGDGRTRGGHRSPEPLCQGTYSTTVVLY